jgi:uncharacterized membrane protein
VASPRLDGPPPPPSRALPPPALARGRRWIVDRLASRINATPEQSEVLRSEADEFFTHVRDLRGEMKGSRSDIARAMRDPLFDETVMGESFARHDDQILEVRKRLVGALVRVHDVLEPEQRDQLAQLIERGPGFRGTRMGW